MNDSQMMLYAACDSEGFVSLVNVPATDGLLSFARGSEAELRELLMANTESVGDGKYLIPAVADEIDQTDAYHEFLEWLEGLRGRGYDHLLIKRTGE